MPEEQNRIVADHLSSFLFCPTEIAVKNLSTEGIMTNKEGGLHNADSPLVSIVGDVMLDASIYYRRLASFRPKNERIILRLNLPSNYRLLTLHRAENTDDKFRLSSIISALNKSNDLPVIFPMHPRTKKCLDTFGLSLSNNIRVIEPVGYMDMLELEESCEMIITDSGGVQKEAYFFHKPCVTLRDQTEWTETIDSGWNTLVQKEKMEDLPAILSRTHRSIDYLPIYGTGRAGNRILELLTES